MLIHCAAPRNSIDDASKLPSWIPDWSIRLSLPVLGSSHSNLFNACKDMVHVSAIEPNSRSLLIRSFLVDGIESLAEDIEPDTVLNTVAFIEQAEILLPQEDYNSSIQLESSWKMLSGEHSVATHSYEAMLGHLKHS